MHTDILFQAVAWVNFFEGRCKELSTYIGLVFVCVFTASYNANYFPGSDKFLLMKSGISHLVGPVTGRH